MGKKIKEVMEEIDDREIVKGKVIPIGKPFLVSFRSKMASGDNAEFVRRVILGEVCALCPGRNPEHKEANAFVMGDVNYTWDNFYKDQIVRIPVQVYKRKRV